MPLFLVVKQDTVITSTGYLVRAQDAEQAGKYVDNGMYIEETTAEVQDTIESKTVQIEEITINAEGQARNES